MAPRSKADRLPVAQNDLLDLVGYNMKRAYMRIYQDFADALSTLDLRQRTFSVLSLVVENPDISQSEVARSLGIERSGTVVIVDELEGRDLIRRDKVPGDRRAYALGATAEGKALYRAALKRIMEHENTLLAGFTQADRAALNRLLQRIHSLKS
jgi:DNA-binding MarR family transcriptional regulator